MKVVIGVENKPRVQFTIDADPSNMPDLIVLKDGSTLMKVGRYASSGDNYSYRRISETLKYDGPVNEWVEYSGLTG